MSTISRRRLLATGGAIRWRWEHSLRAARAATASDQFHHAAELSDRLCAVAQRAGRRTFQERRARRHHPAGQGLGGRGATGDCRTRALRARRSARDGKGHRSGRADHRLRHDLASLADHGLQLAEETDPQRQGHGRQGHRHRRLRQRLRQHPRHDARHERAASPTPSGAKRSATAQAAGA